MTGVRLKGAYVNFAHIIYADGNGRVRGFLPDVLNELRVVLNFTYDARVPEDRSYGRKDKDGKWSGIVGMLQRREVDINIGGQVSTGYRVH